jgi:hypothetical protein
MSAPSGGSSYRSIYVFFCNGRSVTSNRPSGGSPDPSVCPTGGDSEPVLGGDLTVCLETVSIDFYEEIILVLSKTLRTHDKMTSVGHLCVGYDKKQITIVMLSTQQ